MKWQNLNENFMIQLYINIVIILVIIEVYNMHERILPYIVGPYSKEEIEILKSDPKENLFLSQAEIKELNIKIFKLGC